MRSKLPAAAIPEGSIVEIPEEGEVLIDHIENGTPRPGKVTWFAKDGTRYIVGGSTKIQVVKYPHEIEGN